MRKLQLLTENCNLYYSLKTSPNPIIKVKNISNQVIGIAYRRTFFISASGLCLDIVYTNENYARLYHKKNHQLIYSTDGGFLRLHGVCIL